MQLGIDIVSDVICPWCFIGKRRFELTLRAYPDLGFVHAVARMHGGQTFATSSVGVITVGFTLSKAQQRSAT